VGRVDGKVVFITGAGQGQGQAHAVRLAEEGADIVATDICSDLPAINYKQASEADLEETKHLVENLGRRCMTAIVDVRNRETLDRAVDAALAEFGRIDVVCANAGIITFHRSSLEISEEIYDLIVDTCLKGVWNTLQAAVPSMIAAKRGGSIIITSSVAGIRGQAPYAHYVAAKHGVVGLMRAFANELGRYRIRVNTIHPMGVSSPGMGSSPEVVEIYDIEPMFVLGATSALPDLDTAWDNWDPATSPLPITVPTIREREISNAVLFLASDESRYVTGVQLPIDAGNTNTP
jgi:SDR family mycofactocin-dependent oxidoreductase